MLSLNIPPRKLFGWFRSPQLWTTGDWQLHHDNVAAHASCLVQSFLVDHQITQVTQSLSSLDLVPYDFCFFPQTKITFEREEISDHQWDSGKYDGATDGNRENHLRSQGAHFEGDWGVIVVRTVFLLSCIFFNKCLFFIVHGRIPSGQTSNNNNRQKKVEGM